MKDVRDGLISLEKAREDYGVAIDWVGENYLLNENETKRIREIKGLIQKS